MKQKQLERLRLDHEWPIIDDTPIRELRELALAEVRLGAHQKGYRISGNPLVTIKHGANPVLSLSVLAVKR